MQGEQQAKKGPYDGYLTETAGGWEVAAAGLVVGTYADEEVARTVLSEHGAGRPCWKVAADGSATRVTVS